MTPAEIKALTPGASIKDSTGATATVTFTRDRSSAIEIDGLLELRWTQAPHTNRISVFNYNDPVLRRFAPGTSSFWADTDTPTSITPNATLPINVCCIVTPVVSGTITAVQFWKLSTDTGTHTAQVWNPAGSATIATATFAGETATGWQTANLTAPIVGGQTYRVCVSHAVGNWAHINGTFAGSTITGIISMSAQAYYAAGSLNAYPGGDAPNTWFGADVVFVAG
jgi:Domain of unknown function (DUF4082)